jgi:O-methyltransferase involved in polyketide biosynthesis
VVEWSLLTAACRATETGRSVGLVRDPFAARLAGERGFAIVRALPGLETMCFGVGMRGRIMDNVVSEAVPAYGISSVLSVSAGLDTRPWRLALEPDLRWLEVEVDLQPMLDCRADALASEKPKCRIRAPGCRREQPAPTISEGQMYLPATGCWA